MVEGGILAPIFAMMMMMTVYLGGVYQTKYKTFMMARFNGWSYASLNCETSGADQNTSDSNAGQFQGAPQAQGVGAQADGEQTANSSWSIGHGQNQQTWDYEPTYRFNNGPKTIHTESWAMCNQRPYGRNIFSYLWDAVKGSLPSL